MGKVMGLASAQLGGTAEGKVFSLKRNFRSKKTN
jgi:hypothetical protein